MGNDRKKFITDTFLSSFPPLAGLLSSFVIMIFITKFIGVAGYGIWAQFQITFSLLSLFLCLNLGSSIGRFLAGEKEKEYLGKVFYSVIASVLILTILAGLFFYIFKESLANFLFGEKELGIIIILLIIFLIFRNLSRQCQHLLMARRYIKEWTLINLGIFGAAAVLVVLTTMATKNIVASIFAFVVVEGIALAILSGFIWQKGIRPVKPDFGSIVPLLKFGVPLIMTGIGYWIIQSSDRYLIKYFLDISQVGLYSVGYSCAFTLIFLWTAFSGVILPDLSALFDKGKIRELEIRFSRVLKYGVAFSVPGVIGLSILAKPIIKTLSSSEFLPAANVLIIISVGVFFYGMFVHFNTLLSVLKKVKILSSIWILMAVFNLGLNFWLIPKFGIIGAAASTSLCFLLGAVVIVLYSQNYFKIVFQKEWLAKIIIASTLMGILISLITVTSKICLILTILTGALIYGATLLLLKFYDQSELSLFGKIFLKSKR
ncbi:MAG: polysaccharide biosynthesis C-terminal domain-containing protein [bacterium]